jgi:DNA topoisomerase-3
MFHAPYEYEETIITTDMNGLEFTTKGKAEKALGWKELYKADQPSEEESEDRESLLPVVQKRRTCTREDTDERRNHNTTKALYRGTTDYFNEKTCGASVEDEESKSILKRSRGTWYGSNTSWHH